jgi:hypothetical protein
VILDRAWWDARRARRARDLEQDALVLWRYALADAVVATADRQERLTVVVGHVRAMEASSIGWAVDLARINARLCPACRTRPTHTGYSGPYGPGATLVTCCEPCSTVSRAVDHAMTPARDLGEFVR